MDPHVLANFFPYQPIAAHFWVRRLGSFKCRFSPLDPSGKWSNVTMFSDGLLQHNHQPTSRPSTKVTSCKMPFPLGSVWLWWGWWGNFLDRSEWSSIESYNNLPNQVSLEMSCTQLGHLIEMYGFGKLGFPSKDRANGVSHVWNVERDALHFVLIYLAISCLGPSLHVMIDACLAQTAVLADTLRFFHIQRFHAWSLRTISSGRAWKDMPREAIGIRLQNSQKTLMKIRNMD